MNSAIGMVMKDMRRNVEVARRRLVSIDAVVIPSRNFRVFFVEQQFFHETSAHVVWNCHRFGFSTVVNHNTSDLGVITDFIHP